MFEVQFYFLGRWALWEQYDQPNEAKMEAVYLVKKSIEMILRVVSQHGKIIASYEDPEEYDSNGLRRTNG